MESATHGLRFRSQAATHSSLECPHLRTCSQTFRGVPGVSRRRRKRPLQRAEQGRLRTRLAGATNRRAAEQREALLASVGDLLPFTAATNAPGTYRLHQAAALPLVWPRTPRINAFHFFIAALFSGM